MLKTLARPDKKHVCLTFMNELYDDIVIKNDEFKMFEIVGILKNRAAYRAFIISSLQHILNTSYTLLPLVAKAYEFCMTATAFYNLVKMRILKSKSP